jgi:signal peptidase I
MRIAARRPRIAVECCVWLLLTALALETWLVAGIAVPCRVVGGSMAETLLGEHRNVVCADCGRPFVVGVDRAAAAPPLAICPNCGCAAGDFPPSIDLPGDRLLVDREIFSIRPPRRWEIVAFRHPQQADAVLVKRVVGLPGETVEIRDGDVFINGKILRKNLAEQHAVAVLIYDAGCQPTRNPTPPPRWRARREESKTNIKTAWRQIDGVFSHKTDAKAAAIDWLAYHHGRRLPDESGGVCPTPVTDVGGYNQSRPRREEDVHVVRDLLLSLRLTEISGDGAFCIRATDGADTFEAQLQFDGENSRRFRWLIRRNGQQIADSIEPRTVSAAAAKNGLTVEASLVDRQFLLAVEGQTLAAFPYERSKPPLVPPTVPLAVGIERLGATVRELRVYRDVYYTPAMAETAEKSSRVGGVTQTLLEGEYFVLGDNSVISDDSRTFAGRGAIDSNLLIGKPFAAIPTIETSRWHFQVPHFLGIRYIR